MSTYVSAEESGAIIYPRSDSSYNVSAAVEVKLNNLVREHNDRMSDLTSEFADEIESWRTAVNKAEQQIKYERAKAKRQAQQYLNVSSAKVLSGNVLIGHAGKGDASVTITTTIASATIHTDSTAGTSKSIDINSSKISKKRKFA